MYKHILIPTDGSKVAEKAVVEGLKFAKKAKAAVTWFTAMPEYQIPSEIEMMARRAVSMEEYEKQARQKALRILQRLEKRARAAGIKSTSDFRLSDHPADAIVEAAQRHRCDLILMASRNRSGIAALYYGSETRGVLAGSKIPTLVYR
jgi:nucleotide-binding universal stress UspA family protein